MIPKNAKLPKPPKPLPSKSPTADKVRQKFNSRNQRDRKIKA